MANKKKRKSPGKNGQKNGAAEGKEPTETRTEDEAMDDAEQDALLAVEHDRRDPKELFKVTLGEAGARTMACACGATVGLQADGVDADPMVTNAVDGWIAEHAPHMLAELRSVTPPPFDVESFIRSLETTTNEAGEEIKAETRKRILSKAAKRYKAPVSLTDHDLAKRAIRLAHLTTRLADAKNGKRDENSRRTGLIKGIEKEIQEDGAVIVAGKEIQDVPVLEVLDPSQHLVRIYSMVDGTEISARAATDADMQMPLPLGEPKPATVEPTTPPAVEPPAQPPLPGV